MDKEHLNKLIVDLESKLPKLDNASIAQELEVIRAFINSEPEDADQPRVVT